MTRAKALLYGDLRRRGLLIGDADILIAATALENECAVVSFNEGHFGRIDGLVVENWRRSSV
jgi:tRNA(fMet)-specific endonuclease VapC